MVDILAIGAHPDDIEFGAGGILAKAVAAGQTVAMCDLTLGQRGTNGTPAIRKQEAIAAAKLLGAEREFLDFEDCEVSDCCEGRTELARVIRHYKPRLVLAPMFDGVRNHPDHVATGLLARNACRYARFRNILPKTPIHTVDGILHYPQGGCPPDFLVDVTPHLEMWKALINCHTSQLQSRPYLDWVLAGARTNGISIGCEYAQGLVKGNPIVIDNILQVSRGTREL